VTGPRTLAGVQARSYRTLALLVLGAGLAASAFVAVAFPGYRGLVGYGLYAIPAHLLISVLANEPMLFAAAKSYEPGLVAAAGTAGAAIAIVLDYALIGWFVNQRFIREEIDDSRAFRTAQRWFDKAPFALIAIAAMLPVPFYPVKILAIAGNYPLGRSALAVVTGRLPRFWFLAMIGERVQAPDSALLSAGVALAIIAGWGLWRAVRRNRAARRPQGGEPRRDGL
jgi:membrane protein YqaA with SNARE-associated domain